MAVVLPSLGRQYHCRPNGDLSIITLVGPLNLLCIFMETKNAVLYSVCRTFPRMMKGEIVCAGIENDLRERPISTTLGHFPPFGNIGDLRYTRTTTIETRTLRSLHLAKRRRFRFSGSVPTNRNKEDALLLPRSSMLAHGAFLLLPL